MVVLEGFVGALIFPAPVPLLSAIHIGFLHLIWEDYVGEDVNPKSDGFVFLSFFFFLFSFFFFLFSFFSIFFLSSFLPFLSPFFLIFFLS